MPTSNASSPKLQWELLIRKRGSATQGVPPGKEELSWVANTVTLFWGERDALLVDTFLSDAHNAELADWIVAKGKTLRTIYVTHGHPDHFFGLSLLLQKFPDAKAIAQPHVVEAMRACAAPEMVANNWAKRWPGQIPEHLSIAEAFDGDTFELEGHEFRVIDTGHTDTDDTTAAYVPSLDLVVAGDAAYNETHPFLVDSDSAGRANWVQAIDQISALSPKTLIVGHGPLEPDNSPSHLAATRQYILDFGRLAGETSSADELYNRMLELYPNRINPGSLWGSANAAKPKS